MAPAIQQHTETSERQRRSDCRYPVDAEVFYTVIRPDGAAEAGRGRTIDISQSGLLFESTRALPRAQEIELFIAWPARLKHLGAVKLHAMGRTVRTHGNFTAVRILRCQFRTHIICQLPLPPALSA
jgi:hypothetical protein